MRHDMEDPGPDRGRTARSDDGAHDQALLFVHLDGLGPLVDGRGAAAADAVRAEVAERLTRAVRRSDLVAPNGPDGFVVLCPGIRHAEAEALARRLTTCFDDRAGAGAVGVTVRVGAAHGPHQCSYHELLGRADAALGRALRGGPDRRLVFDAGDRLLDAIPGSRHCN